MKKIFYSTMVLLCIMLTLSQKMYGQDDIYTELSNLFNEYDYSPTTISSRYTQLPNGEFFHAQVLNIPASSQADLLRKVLIIVDSTLYTELTFEINRYAYDIHHVYGCNVIMEQVNSETFQDIKALIVNNNYQNNLDGCVFVGDIAPAFYNANDVINHKIKNLKFLLVESQPLIWVIS